MRIPESQKMKVYLHLEKIRIKYDNLFFQQIKRFLDEELLLILLKSKPDLSSIKNLLTGRQERLVNLLFPLYKEAAIAFFNFQSKSRKGFETLEKDLYEIVTVRSEQIIHSTYILLESLYNRSPRVDDFLKQVSLVYKPLARAMRIAKTEVNMVSNLGLIKAASYNGMKTKYWICRKDPTARETHQSMDMEERPIEDFFSNGLLFPGDPLGKSNQIINCRCFQIFI